MDFYNFPSDSLSLSLLFYRRFSANSIKNIPIIMDWLRKKHIFSSDEKWHRKTLVISECMNRDQSRNIWRHFHINFTLSGKQRALLFQHGNKIHNNNNYIMKSYKHFISNATFLDWTLASYTIFHIFRLFLHPTFFAQKQNGMPFFLVSE